MIFLFILFLFFTFFFFFNDTATTEIYTLSLHDALPICHASPGSVPPLDEALRAFAAERLVRGRVPRSRSEEHTSELQSRSDLVCRLLLEKKKTTTGLAPDAVGRARMRFVQCLTGCVASEGRPLASCFFF